MGIRRSQQNRSRAPVSAAKAERVERKRLPRPPGRRLRTLAQARLLLRGREDLLAGEYVGGEDLRWGGEEFVGLGCQRSRDLALDVCFAGLLAAESVEDPE